MIKNWINIRKKDEEAGYTLLEYCAGAAVIAGIVFGALNALGGNLEGLLQNLGTWVDDRAADIVSTTNTNP
jgi:Flp pilus assembly pilin Flp